MNQKVKEIKELMLDMNLDFGLFTEEEFEIYFEENLIELKIIDILEKDLRDLHK